MREQGLPEAIALDVLGLDAGSGPDWVMRAQQSPELVAAARTVLNEDRR